MVKRTGLVAQGFLAAALGLVLAVSTPTPAPSERDAAEPLSPANTSQLTSPAATTVLMDVETGRVIGVM